MSEKNPENDQRRNQNTSIDHAVGLLSQQVWCWGRDVLRPEGNWLLELGFDRIEPPTDRNECSSVYSLELPDKRCVMLRGFGVFYFDFRRGGVFLPRYEFQPKYTTDVGLERQPWAGEDLPDLSSPTNTQKDDCAALVLELIDWIGSYEVNLVECLGIEYRRATLTKWDSGERPFTPAEKLASSWRELALQINANFDAYLM